MGLNLSIQKSVPSTQFKFFGPSSTNISPASSISAFETYTCSQEIAEI